MSDTKWMRQAACAGQNSELWFPETGRSDQIAEAKTICADCPVQTDCLTFAITEQIEFGVWGGRTAMERRGTRFGPTRPPIVHGTYNGYRQHRRRGERACESCLLANNRYAQDLAAKARLNKETA